MRQDYLTSSQCRLSAAKTEFFKVNSAFVLAKGSPYRPLFDRKYVQKIKIQINSLLNCTFDVILKFNIFI